MATTISTQDIVDVKRDIDDIGKAVNEKVIVYPRYGKPFKSLPMISAEFQISSDAAEAAAVSAAESANIAQSSANIAEAAATAATIGAGVFDTPEAGVDPVTGVADGAYFNVRSPNDESYVDEYQNVGGVATATGKSYPSAEYVSSFPSRVVSRVDSIADLLTIQNPKDGQVVYVKSYYAGLNKGGGVFIYSTARQLENDGGNVIHGWVRQGSRNYFSTYNYGAIGDGLVNNNEDTVAFKRLEAAVLSAPAATLHIEHGKYIVGNQTFVAGQGFTNNDIFNLDTGAMVDKKVIIKSDNACIKFKDGMYYGVFNKTTKERFDPVMPYYPGTASYIANSANNSRANVGNIITISNISNLLMFGDLELDGNINGAVLGGQYGDTGWQIGANCLYIKNVKNFDISNIFVHDSCQDGLYIAGHTPTNGTKPEHNGVVRNVRSVRGARQNMSLTGGQNISFYDCYFDDAGTPSLPFASMPRACVDIEAEISTIRNIRFYNCYFGRAGSQSLVAQSGNSADVHFYSCRFINDVGSTVWVNKPRFKFYNCYINGYVEKQYNTNIQSDRTLYRDCTFTDDPAQNPNFTAREYLLVMTGSNPILEDCTLDVYKSGVIYSYGANPTYPLELNNFIINIYGGIKDKIALGGTGYIRFRDHRPAGTRTNQYINSQFKGTVVIEKIDDLANALTPYGFTAEVFQGIKPKYYKNPPAKAASVANATATDDTATKLNALIASLRDAGYMS